MFAKKSSIRRLIAFTAVFTLPFVMSIQPVSAVDNAPGSQGAVVCYYNGATYSEGETVIMDNGKQYVCNSEGKWTRCDTCFVASKFKTQAVKRQVVYVKK